MLPFFVHSPYHFLCTRDFCLHLDEKDKKPDYDRRRDLRQEKAYPEIRKFETWMEVNMVRCGLKSLMEEAISYTDKILKKLSLYTTDGRYRIDDKMVENSIRPLAIGRKNYLFCGDDCIFRSNVGQ